MIHYSGEPMKIGFNAKYVLEFLATLKSGTVEFCLRDSQNPGILRSAENPEHTYVIMPMRM
jgi:DNA polymerase-3 subunit beta